MKIRSTPGWRPGGAAVEDLDGRGDHAVLAAGNLRGAAPGRDAAAGAEDPRDAVRPRAYVARRANFESLT